SYRFGKTGPGKREVDPEKEQAQVLAQEEREQEAATKEMERARIQKERDSLESLAQWQITQRLLGERQRRDSMALVVQQRKRDSLTLAVQVRRKDSLMALASQKVELLPQEKFEEIQGEEGLEPGFYLIANVFGTKN